jgi:myo-inositol-1(or 4)-monophosphatase
MINDPILAVAVRAARRAGSIINDAARDLKRLASHAMQHGDIASTADTDAEKAIIATLRTAFPGHAILGEGADVISPDAAPGAADGYRWIIDPIDGTTNFVHGFPYYAVSIALALGQDITHAVVHDPIHDELFMAIRGKGAQLNGAPIRVSACTSLERALVGTVFPTPASPGMPTYLGVFGTLIPRCGGVRRAGACALDLAYLAAGRLDGFWVMSLRPREVAAGALIVREAGGRVGDFAGGGEFLRTNEVIAAAPGIFNSLRETIVGALPASRDS